MAGRDREDVVAAASCESRTGRVSYWEVRTRRSEFFDSSELSIGSHVARIIIWSVVPDISGPYILGMITDFKVRLQILKLIMLSRFFTDHK
jgi:hypothetical protein